MRTVFISYRRADSSGIAGRIYDRLRNEYGEQLVFFDVDSIPAGVRFRDYIRDAIRDCGAIVAIIGRDWLGFSENGIRRIDEPDDYVRQEVQFALDNEIPILPILVDDTKMPTADELPVELRPLADCNALKVDTGSDFEVHVGRLLERLGAIVERHRRIPRVSEPEPDKRTTTLTDDDFEDKVLDYKGVFIVFAIDPSDSLWGIRAYDMKKALITMGVHEFCIGFLEGIGSHRSVAAHFNIRKSPTVLFFRDGELVERLDGVFSEHAMVEAVEKVVGKASLWGNGLRQQEADGKGACIALVVVAIIALLIWTFSH
ncbi:MAG: TIR domain-containing protein [Planctomycetaceae bacterium]|nr:TIR domain-containing protein [Planctomycetaceae bacterium]MCB9951672.1 TIR domain-containing protein [Planctomycetaceae bacterium]